MGDEWQPFKSQEDLAEIEIDGKLIEPEMKEEIEHIMQDEPQFSLLEYFFGG